MSAFFEYCVKCGKMFGSAEAWEKHKQLHAANATSKKNTLRPFKEVEKKLEIENAANVPGADRGQIEDERLARIKELREMKKELKEAGIECATMNAAETQAAYAQLKNTDKKKGE